MHKIVLTGPESTGKTSLAKALANHYQAPWVPEYAREYLEALGRDYLASDLLEIAKGQLALEDTFALQAPAYLFCDTSLVVLKIWSEYKYGQCDPWILTQLATRSYDLYFLCGIDVPWEADPLREHPNERAQLYDQYKSTLQQLALPFVELTGNLEKRLKKAQVSLLDYQKNL
ncbi:MAG: AAA family ATPase [Saprospiraceae bacterium]